INLTVIDDLFLVRRRRAEKHEEIVSLLRGHLGRSARGELADRDVIDRDVRVVPFAPLARKVVEPAVVRGDEMGPLKDLQRFLRGPCAAGEEKRAGESSDHAPAAEWHSMK